jgi:hypothetical protein
MTLSFIETWQQARALREQTHPADPDSGTFKWSGNPHVVYSTKSPTAHLDNYVLEPAKQFWLREEIPIADELLSLVPSLTEDFFKCFQSLDDYAGNDYREINGKRVYGNVSYKGAWQSTAIKFSEITGTGINPYKDKVVQQLFPTACSLTEKYANDCLTSSYSLFERNSVIKRHRDLENSSNEFLRIHIPLIIPEGDVFFECEGVEIDWSDIWAFDNQLTHSAYNNSDQRRLIFIIDIRRSYLGIPNGKPFDGIRNIKIPPFVRGALPKILHAHQR